MTGLLDIGPLSEEVTIRGNKITVGGIPAEGLFFIFQSFPEVRKLISGFDVDDDLATALLAKAGEAVAHIIASGTGHPGEKKHIEVALSLTAGETLALLKPILGLTFPQGMRSFLEALTEMFVAAGGPDLVQATTSPVRSSGL